MHTIIRITKRIGISIDLAKLSEFYWWDTSDKGWKSIHFMSCCYLIKDGNTAVVTIVGPLKVSFLFASKTETKQ